jgi:hypothetical protein
VPADGIKAAHTLADSWRNKLITHMSKSQTTGIRRDQTIFMNIINLTAFVALVVTLTSCATRPPPQAFHNTDNAALVIASLDDKTCQMLQPTTSSGEKNDEVLAKAMALPQHLTAVVMLENYTESRIGDQFRDRGTVLFVGLRYLGYQHIVFLQGRGVANPDGLITLAEYE